MIDVAIETLIDLNLAVRIALADRGDDSARSGYDHLAQHAVLDAERAVVLEEDDLVTGREISNAILRPEGMAGLDGAPLDECLAGALVQITNVDAQMSEDQRGFGWIVGTVPVGDQLVDRLGLEVGADHLAFAGIGRDRCLDPSARQVERGRPHPGFVLTIDRLELGIASALDDGAEGGARFDRLQLLGIADQH